MQQSDPKEIIVLGGGTAGLLCALSLQKSYPLFKITVLRSKSMGHIMVGEGTFAATPNLLHNEIGLPKDEFLRVVTPTLKLGIRFLWGSRPYFDFPFFQQYDGQIFPSQDKPWGYYHLDRCNFSPPEVESIFNDEKGAIRFGYHFENDSFVTFLETHFTTLGGILIDKKCLKVTKKEGEIEFLKLDDGTKISADLFIDASGFSGLLINDTLGVPYIDMNDTLFCDRAVVGGWERQDNETIKHYTTAETMDAGWCWKIEHTNRINRGYVFASEFLTDEDATIEFLQKNPRIDRDSLRVIGFRSRRISQAWAGNVVAMGNACGFVEPLEATNIQLISVQSQKLSKLIDKYFEFPEQTRQQYSAFVEDMWLDIRDFIALHYKFNDRLDTDFWRHAKDATPLGNLSEFVRTYQQKGPTAQSLSSIEKTMFGADGVLALLLGMKVPWTNCEID